MRNLKPCPCGDTPKRLILSESPSGVKWAYASGDCCGSWEVEFRTQYNPLNSQPCKELAREAWNSNPRGEQRFKDFEEWWKTLPPYVIQFLPGYKNYFRSAFAAGKNSEEKAIKN